MNIADLQITIGWMTWDEIKPFKEQLIALEQILFRKYHYPDRYNGEEYCVNHVGKLEQYLANGNTYFWGARCADELIGYYWAYTTQFVDKKRWVLSSLMIKEKYQKMGLGTRALEEGFKMAKRIGCDEASTGYVPWNTAAAKVYQRAGYTPVRIEAVKYFDKCEEEDDSRET